MGNLLLVGAGAVVARQTGEILERTVDPDRVGPGTQHGVPYVPHASDLVIHVAEHRVVGVAGIARPLGGYPPVLKMRRGNEARMVYQQTFGIGLDHVTGNTERRRLGLLVMAVGAPEQQEPRQEAERKERKDLAPQIGRQFGTSNDKGDHAESREDKDAQDDGEIGHSDGSRGIRWWFLRISSASVLISVRS